MKLIEFKEYKNLDDKTLNRRKIIITTVIGIILFLVVVFVSMYVFSAKFRNWADNHILMKTVKQGTLAHVDINSDENEYVFAYDKYIALLNNNKLDIYNSSAKKVETFDLNISNPLFSSNGKYLSVAEKEKQKIYLLAGTKKVWEKEVDGVISRVSVNENGYVSAVCSGTTYKSVIIVFDQNGNELFKTYIPNNKIVDSEISSDNKYLSFAEVDTSGTLIKSVVKTISIKDAQSSAENPVVYTYEMPTNSLAINIKYHGSKNLVCMCDDGINLLSDGQVKQIMNFKEDNKNYTFAGVNLINNIYKIEEITEDVSKQYSYVRFTNTGTKSESKYIIPSIAKSTTSSGDITAVNLGTEVYFISTRGFLKKKYVATEEIRNVILSERIAAIVFRDHVEIMML